MTESIIDGAPVADGLTSDQLLEKIEAEQRELDKKNAKPASSVEPEPVSETDPVEPKAADKPIEPVETSEAQDEVSAPGEGDKVDETEEWLKKKGLPLDVKSLAKSVRNLEKKMHQMANEKKRLESQVIEPGFTPRPQFTQPMPSVPVEELAKRYNLDPTDFERITPLINDAADVKVRSALAPLVSDLQRMKQELRREKEMTSLESDPHFQNREVLKEMYQILENDPSILATEAEPYRAAFDKALSNIGRKYVETHGMNNEASDNSRESLPRTPPPVGKGTGSGPKGSPIKGTSKMTPEKFASLSSAEMEKYLANRGLIQK